MGSIINIDLDEEELIDKISDEVVEKLKSEREDWNQENEEDDEFIDEKEASDLTSISVRQLKRYRRKRKIPFRKVEGKILYKKKELINSIDQYKIFVKEDL